MMEGLRQNYDTKDIEGESEHNLNKNKASCENHSVHEPKRPKLEQSGPEAGIEIEQSGPEVGMEIEQPGPEAGVEIEQPGPEAGVEIEQPCPQTSSKLEQQDPGASSDGSSLIETRPILDTKTANARWVKNGRRRTVYLTGTNGPDIVFTCILPPKEKRSRPTLSDYGWGPVEIRGPTKGEPVKSCPPEWSDDDEPADDFYTLYPQLKGWDIVDSDDD